VRISQAARARAAQVEAIEVAAERARSKRRARALAEVYARCEDLDALALSLERELAAVRERYAVKADVLTAARDGALLDLADLGRLPAAIAESVGLSTREVARALTAARRARGLDTDADETDTGEDDAPDTDTAQVPATPAVDTSAAARSTAPATVVRLDDRRPAAPDAMSEDGAQPVREAGVVLPVAVGQDLPLPLRPASAVRERRSGVPAPVEATPPATDGGGEAALF